MVCGHCAGRCRIAEAPAARRLGIARATRGPVAERPVRPDPGRLGGERTPVPPDRAPCAARMKTAGPAVAWFPALVRSAAAAARRRAAAHALPLPATAAPRL